MTPPRRWAPAVVAVAVVATACGGDDGDTTPTAATGAPSSTADTATTTGTAAEVTASSVAATTIVATSTTAAPTAPGLEAILAAPGDVVFPITPTDAAGPVASFCNQPDPVTPLDARRRTLTSGDGNVVVTSSAELHTAAGLAVQALEADIAALTECDWTTVLPPLTRSTDLNVRVVPSPEAVAAVTGCQQSAAGGVVRTTTDDGAPDRQEVLVVAAACGALVVSVRFDFHNQPPIDRSVWVSRLINLVFTRAGAAAN